MKLTKENVQKCLSNVIDPELDIDIVSMGLIYDVSIGKIQLDSGERDKVHILMTLTTPGCPLIGVFDKMVKDSLAEIEGLDINKDVELELTFDPPWITDMMTEEARAEVGF
jgi:metal-sulfur cluster biosynthetic enzyme